MGCKIGEREGMISDFENHAAMVVFFGICAVIWIGTLFHIWRNIQRDDNDDKDGVRSLTNFWRNDTLMYVLILPPFAAYLIISKAW